MKKLAILIALALLTQAPAAASEYAYGYWLNGWRKNVNDRSEDLFGVKTNHFGFTLNVANLRRAGFGRFEDSSTYEQALDRQSDALKQLPPAELLIELEVDGKLYRANTCRAGRDRGVKRLSHARLWESGRYVQHYDFAGLDFRDDQGQSLACDGILDLVAWPGSLTFNLIATPAASHKNAVMRLALSSQPTRWSYEEKIESWESGQEKRISLTCVVGREMKRTSADVTVTTANNEPIPVQFDETKDCYVAHVERLKRNWKVGYTDVRNYDEFTIRVKGDGSPHAIPFLLDLRRPANVTGLCPILCDEDGRPTAIPVQLSKNWHYKPMGSYLMAYTMLPRKSDATYTLRIVYGFYGHLPAASHSQLCLIGYGGNGRWDQLAIGCWGETICFDMDRSLVDVAVTDIRGLMLRRGIQGKKWSWTNAGWGGDWLYLQDADGERYLSKNQRTAYLSHGPCLTNVKHHGYYGTRRQVEFAAQIRTLRTDDYARTFQKLKYTFTQDVTAKNLYLFKLGRTSAYSTPRVAYGNKAGLLKELDVPRDLRRGDEFLSDVKFSGDSPYWLAFTGAAEHAPRNPMPNGYRAIVIRDFKAVLGDKTYTRPTFRTPVFKANPTGLDLELHPPASIREFRAGDVVEMDVELITLPRIADDYYGPNKTFRAHLTSNENSWKTTWREARGNHLNVESSGGQVLQNYPIVIQVEKPEVAVAIRGGVGAVPICFQGLQSPSDFRLYAIEDGQRKPYDPSVFGNDYWQLDYDVASRTYTVTYNLPMDDRAESQWVFAQ